MLAFSAFAPGVTSATFFVSILFTSLTAAGMCFLLTVSVVLYSIAANFFVVSYKLIVVHAPPPLFWRHLLLL